MSVACMWITLPSPRCGIGKKGAFDLHTCDPVKYRFDLDDDWPLDLWRAREGRVVLLSGEVIDAEQRAAEPEVGDLRIDSVTDLRKD